MASINFAASQNALSTAAEKIANSDARRFRYTVLNMDATITVYIGPDSTVTSAIGFPLVAGAAFTFEGPSALGEVWAIAASGTPSVALLEEYN